MRSFVIRCLFLLLAVGAYAQSYTVSGISVFNGFSTSIKLTTGQACFTLVSGGGPTCMTVVNGAFSGSLATGTYNLAVTNSNSGQLILTLLSVPITANWTFDTYTVPVAGFSLYSGIGTPYLPCAAGALYSRTDPSNPLFATYTCGTIGQYTQWYLAPFNPSSQLESLNRPASQAFVYSQLTPALVPALFPQCTFTNGTFNCPGFTGISVNGVSNPVLGMDNSGITDISAALQSNINSGQLDFYIPPGYYNLGTTSIIIPATVHRFESSPGAVFLYQGTGIAIEYRGLGTSNSNPIQYFFSAKVVHGTIVGGVPTPQIHWHDGGSPDLTSVGVVCRNCYHVDWKAAAQGFWTGAALIGDGPTAAAMGGSANGGAAENEIWLGNIEDNMIGYQHLVISSGPNIGWTNQNNIFHGEPRINGNQCVGGIPAGGPYPGTKYILMSTGSDNMNTFYGTELEGVCVERALDIYGSSNTWKSPRFEGMQPNSVVFESTAYGNHIETPFISRYDGTGNGTIASVLVDNGFSNEVHGYSIPSWQADASGSNENLIQFTDSNTVTTATYTSAGTGTFTGTVGQTCNVALVSTVGGTAGGAAATVALTGTNTIAASTAMTMTNNGQFYGNTYPAPTTGNLTSGTATCSGTVNLTSTVGKTIEFYYNNASRTMVVGGPGVGVVKTGSFLFQDGSSVPKLLNGNLTVPNAVLFGTSLLGTVGGGNLLRLYSNNNTDQNQVSLSVDAGNTSGSSGAKLISTYNSGGTTDFRIYNAGLLAAMFHLGNVGLGGAITPTHPLEIGSSAQASIDSSGNGILASLSMGTSPTNATATKAISPGSAGVIPVSGAGGTIDPSYLPTATGSVIGAVKPDGTTISVSGGVLSTIGAGAGTCYRVASLGTPTTTTGGTVQVTMATLAMPALLTTSQVKIHYDAFGNAGNTGTLTATTNWGASLLRSIGGISAVNTYQIVDEELRNMGSTSANMETVRYAKTGAAIFLTNVELTVATGSAQNFTVKFTPTVAADTWVLKDADVIICP